MNTQAARAAATVAVAALATTLGACGDDEADEPAAGQVALSGLEAAIEADSCPPEYLVLRSGQRYSRAAVRRASERGLFDVHEARLRLAPPVDWLQDPYRSKAFRGRLADLDWLGVLFQAYREGDAGALRQARDLVLDWIASQPRGGEGTSDQAWQGKAAGDRVLNLAYLARAAACEGLLAEDQLRELAGSLEQHVEVLTSPKVYEPTNHGLYMDLSLALLSRQLEGADGAGELAELARRRYERTFGRRIVEGEGLWLEHSAGYQLLLTKVLAKSLATPGFESAELEAVLDRMRDVSGWLVMPDGGIPQFGHTDQTKAPSFARRRARDDEGLLFLPRSGLAVVKEPGAYLSVLASFFSTAHKQADELNFDLYDGGIRVVSDTGLYHKDRDRFFAFASSPAAHSTLTVDGEGFGLADDEAYGSGLIAAGEGDGWYAILGRNPLLERQGVDHRRLFLYRPHEALIVADRVRSDERHVYRRHFQLGPQVEAEEVGGGPRSLAPGQGITATRQLLLYAAGRLIGALETASGRFERLELARGEDDPLRGFVFPAFRERVPRWTATFESRAADGDYTTTILLGVTDEGGARRDSAAVEWEGPNMATLHTGEACPEIRREGRRLHLDFPDACLVGDSP